jgi:hypothetical protein
MTKKTLFLGWSSGYPLQSQAKWPLYDASIGKQKETHLTENPHQRMIPNWVYSGMARRTHRNTKSVEGSFRHCIFTLWCCNFKTWIKHNPWRLWLQTAHSSSLPNVLNGQEEWSDRDCCHVTHDLFRKANNVLHFLRKAREGKDWLQNLTRRNLETSNTTGIYWYLMVLVLEILDLCWKLTFASLATGPGLQDLFAEPKTPQGLHVTIDLGMDQNLCFNIRLNKYTAYNIVNYTSLYHI